MAWLSFLTYFRVNREIQKLEYEETTLILFKVPCPIKPTPFNADKQIQTESDKNSRKLSGECPIIT
jgi:hypothetical protein